MWNWGELRALRTKQQRNNCAICGIQLKRACLDHDHKSGKIRGVLCFKCNSGLGHFEDSSTILLKALQYLNKWNKQRGNAFTNDKCPDPKMRVFHEPKLQELT
jgi:hypothetical protein